MDKRYSSFPATQDGQTWRSSTRSVFACVACGMLWTVFPTHAAEQAGEAKAALERLSQTSLTGITAKHFDEAADSPTFLKFKLPPKVRSKGLMQPADYTATAKEFLVDYKDVLGLASPEAEMQVSSTEIDPGGRRHVRFQQTQGGLKVWGKEAIVHLDETGSVYLFNGRYQATAKSVDLSPKLAKEAGVAVVLDDFPGQAPVINETEELIYPTSEGPRLAYRVNVSVGMTRRWDYFVDAHDGNVLDRISNVYDTELVEASGLDAHDVQRKFYAVNFDGVIGMVSTLTSADSQSTVRREGPTLAKAIPSPQSKGFSAVYSVQNSDSLDKIGPKELVVSKFAERGWDPIALSALHNTQTVHDYFLKTFKRNGPDNKGMRMISVVHFGKGIDNAFWISGPDIMVYGDGGEVFHPLAKCLDVAAHEVTHGLTAHTAKLQYQNQSGALSESFSDVFAAMIDREDWHVGEDCTRGEPGYLRSLSNPREGLGPQPMKMSEFVTTDKDHGGVHINSGIPNYAAYLTATALGRDKTEQIYYQALTNYLSPTSTFIDARRALIQAAEDLNGPDSPEVIAVAQAWDTVEVMDRESAPERTPPASGQTEAERSVEDAINRMFDQ